MAANRKTLSRFSVQRRDDSFLLHIEDDAGETIEFEATADQVDLIIDTLDELLAEDDSLEEVED